MHHIAEELIRLATFADLNCACSGELPKYFEDQFLMRVAKSGDVTNSVD